MKTFSSGNFCPIIIALIIIIGFQPFFVWGFFGFIAGFISFLFSIICLNKIYVDKRHFLSILLIITLYIVLAVRNAFSGTLSLFGILSILFIIPIFIVDKKLLIKAFDIFRKIVAVILILSLINYVLVVWMGVPIPRSYIEPLNQEKLNDFFKYPFLITSANVDSPLFYRFHGIFDEPGVVGTICGVLLICENINLRDKYNVCLLLAGLMTFSFFFYIIIITYVILFSKIQYKLLAFSIILFFVILLQSSDLINSLVFSRFEFSDGQLSGDNRSTFLSDTWYNQFKHSNDYFFGLGPGTASSINVGGCSYKDIIINYGVIYFVLYIVAFLYRFITNNRKIRQFVIYTIILISVIYQRPFIANISYAFLIFVPIYYISSAHNEL